MFTERQYGNNMQNILTRIDIGIQEVIHWTYKQIFSKCWHVTGEIAVNKKDKVSALMQFTFQKCGHRVEGR